MSTPRGRERQNCRLRLRLGGHEVEFGATVPERPVRIADLLPALQKLTDLVVEAIATHTVRLGERIACRAGCGACCRQPVPVAEVEAIYLAELVGRMPADRSRRVRRRFEAALTALAQGGLLDSVRQLPRVADEEARRRIGVEYFRLHIPCPFLDSESCSIHPHRPLACREYLVVSPPAHCSQPKLGVERVALPVKPSQLLYRFGDGAGRDRPRWLPLVLALEWAARGRATRAARRFLGPGLLERFVGQLARGPRRGEAMA